jgi:phosphate transport system substrate-binding protein
MNTNNRSFTKSFIAALFFAVILFSFIGCNNKPQKPLDTTTSGSIKISIDETFQPIVQAELDVFHALYNKATIKTSYKPESDAVNDLLKDSAQLIVIPRELSAQEKKTFEALNMTMPVSKFAIDAIALITNPANPDSTFTMAQIRDIFSGAIKQWDQLDKNGSKEDINVVFDNANSSTVRYIKEVAGGKGFSSKAFFAQNNNPEVIEYVSSHKNALGIIGVNWISDSDDSTTTNFLKKIKVVAIAPDENQEGAGEFRKPYQAYIAQGVYPLTRKVYVIVRGGRAGLAAGFASFICGDKGQRIVLKSGLLPATMPIRIVEIKNNNLFE